MTQYGFYFDSTRCVGCKACSVACKETYHLPINNLYRRVYDYQGGSWKVNAAGQYEPEGVFAYKVSIACNHCANPACVANCPTGAMTKDPETGIVTSDHDACIGCQTCVASCPYSHPSLNEDEGYIIKCDMCADEVAAGNKPLCVLACPCRALDWDEYDALVAKYGQGVTDVEPLPAQTTNPCLIINAHKDAQVSGQGTGACLTWEEEL